MTEQEKILIGFTNLYQKAKPIPFDLSWSDGIGHFQQAVYKSFDTRDVLLRAETPGHRRIMILVQTLGNVVLYDRYAPEDRRGNYIAFDSRDTCICNEESLRVLTLKRWDDFLHDYQLRMQTVQLA